MKQVKTYPCADFVTDNELKNLGVETIGLNFLDLSKEKRNVRAILTGEKRCPQAGEWFLSGAIVEAYRAPNDFTTVYHIAKLVMTKTTIITKIEII